jgi:hypothetical protein
MKKMIVFCGSIALLTAGCSPVLFSKQSETVAPTVTPQGSGTPVPGTPTPTPNPGTPTPTPTPTDTTTYDVTFSQTVPPATTKLDVVMILDTSNSMANDARKLAAGMGNFLSSMANSQYLDWQMCLTVTHAYATDASTCTPVTPTGLQSPWGVTYNWSSYGGSPAYIMKKGSLSASQISSIVDATFMSFFTTTTDSSGNTRYLAYACTNDERGIKAAYHHMDNYPNCYRSDAALAYIVISDEDERSVGDHAADYQYMGQLLTEEMNKPVDLTTEGGGALRDKVQAKWKGKKMTFNSIIVQPPPAGQEKSKTTCKVTQDQDQTASTTAKPWSRYGYYYRDASTATNGAVGNICDSDFGVNLNQIYTKITNSLDTFTLSCAPYPSNSIRNIVVTPSMGTTPTPSVSGTTVKFTPSIPEGSTLSFTYSCLKSASLDRLRGIASAPEGEESLWSRVVRWWQSLISSILPDRTQSQGQ